MQAYLIGVLAGYLVGSIPSAYLLVRKRSGLDIRQAGSGNVGSFNTFVVTNSVWAAVAVGVLDAMKGGVAVLGATILWHEFWPVAATLSGAILGHIFPFWLRFRGGRGLATACGGLFGIGITYTLIWCAVWTVMKLAGGRILPSNAVALLVTPALVWVIPDRWIEALAWPGVGPEEYRIFGIVLSLLLLVGHRSMLSGSGEQTPSS